MSQKTRDQVLGQGNRGENHTDWALGEHMGTGKYPALFCLVVFFLQGELVKLPQ